MVIDAAYTPPICATPYYHKAPKNLAENMAYRKSILRAVRESPQLAHEVQCRCKRDILYWINVFGWTFDPRINPPKSRWVPFITYDYQDVLIIDVLRVMGEGDLLVEKSRDMGASWCLLLPLIWLSTYYHDLSFLLLSRTEDYVDKSGNPKSLFWKVENYLLRLPSFIRPVFSKTHMHIHFEETDSVIDGESTTGDAGRGDRRSAIMLDEFAAVEDGARVLQATRDAAPTRLFNSTPKGARGAFYEMRQNPNIRKHRLIWSMHPEKGKDQYKDAQGKLRSPWYDHECERAMHAMEIAQEVDIDYHASDSTFFDAHVIQRILDEDVLAPQFIGDLTFDAGCAPMEFKKMEDGPLKLWITVQDNAIPSAAGKRFIIGIDVATGTKNAAGRGGSNSCMSIVDADTGEQVGEYTISGMDPTRFGKVCVAVAKWFNNAFMIWESNGPGYLFGETVMATSYTNVYYRMRKEGSVLRRPSDVPGWHSGKDSKYMMLGEYARALRTGRFKNRSRSSVLECRHYIYVISGGVAHSRCEVRGADPSGARDNHGDHVIACGVANLVLVDSDNRSAPASTDKPEPRLGTFAARQQKRLHLREHKMEEANIW